MTSDRAGATAHLRESMEQVLEAVEHEDNALGHGPVRFIPRLSQGKVREMKSRDDVVKACEEAQTALRAEAAAKRRQAIQELAATLEALQKR